MFYNKNKSKFLVQNIEKYIDLESFNFILSSGFLFLAELYYLHYNLYQAAYANAIIFFISLILCFAPSKYFDQKVIISSFCVFFYFSSLYILYGKSFGFFIFLFLTCFIPLIEVKFFKTLVILFILFLSLVLLVHFNNFFGFDYGNSKYYKTDIYSNLQYTIFLFITFYLIIFQFLLTTKLSAIHIDLESKKKEIENSRLILQKLQHNKENFFAIISHEIRTPLNAIKGISDILKTQVSNKEHNSLLDVMDYSSNHLLALVNNILDFTKLNDGVFSLQKSDYNLQKALLFVFKMNESKAIEKGLEYQFECSETLPSFVFGDENRINQIVLNLLNNAIEHTDTGFIKVSITGNYNSEKRTEFLLNITIADSGKGIDPKLKEVIFEKYTTNNSNSTSIGLGLNITKGLIELMNGTISLTSEVGVGTTFLLALPLEISQSSSSPFLNEADSDSNINSNFNLNSNIKFLLVDDNKINLLVLEKQLQNYLKKASFFISNNGQEAIEALESQSFDIILMDILMPVMDGLTATKIIRTLEDKQKRNIPILAITANVSEMHIVECKNAGMNNYVYKPFEIKNLIETIFKELA